VTPEQKVAFLKRQILLMTGLAIIGHIAGLYVIGKQEKELEKYKLAFRTMTDVASLYEEYAPSEVLAAGNEKLAFAQIQIKFNE
jgi:hypothetical protein